MPLDFTLRNFLVKFKNLPFLKGDKSKNCYILNMSTEDLAKHKAKELSGALKNHPALEAIKVGYSRDSGYYIAVQLARSLSETDPVIPKKIGDFPVRIYEPHPNRPDIVDKGL